MTKVCSRKTCKKTHDTTFKQCPQCRESARRSCAKRKKVAAKKVVDGLKICSACGKKNDTKFKYCPKCRESNRRSQAKCLRIALKKVQEGFQTCISCLKIKPNADFESKVHRRNKMTTRCQHCRDLQRKNQKNPSTKVGKCREFWQNWKKEQTCVDCGLQDYRVLEADHVRGEKVHTVSDYHYWSYRGGVDAMRKELKKCVPRCRICHTLKTKERSDLKRMKEGRKQQPSIECRQNEINAIKLNIGACVYCNRKVTPATCRAFDFDHLDEKNKIICISKLAYKSQTYYVKHLRSEISKCQLLCRNCHKIKTYYPQVTL